MPLFSPPVVAQGESVKLRLIMAPGWTAPVDFLIVDPDGIPIVSAGADPTVFGFTLIYSDVGNEVWDRLFNFSKKGLYSFRYLDAAMVEFHSSTFSAEWAANIDAKISDINKQRTDINRLGKRQVNPYG